MKNILFALLVVAAATVVAPGSASAQTDPALVKIPFQFIVGSTLLPAGSYRIVADTQDASLLTIVNLQGKPAAMLATTGRAVNPDPMSPQAHVTFKNVDGQYFLASVATPGADMREVSITKTQAEQVLARLNLLPAERADTAK